MSLSTVTAIFAYLFFTITGNAQVNKVALRAVEKTIKLHSKSFESSDKKNLVYSFLTS
jgi:hypothetical protein